MVTVREVLVSLCETLKDIANTVNIAAVDLIERNFIGDIDRHVPVLVSCIENFPIKTSFYASLIALIRAKVDDGYWIHKVLVSVAERIESRLKSGNVLAAKLLLRFLSDLVGSKVITADSLFVTLGALLKHGSQLGLYLTLNTVLFFPPTLSQTHSNEIALLFSQIEQVYQTTSNDTTTQAANLSQLGVSSQTLEELVRGGSRVVTVIDRLMNACLVTRQNGWPRQDSGVLRLYENARMNQIIAEQPHYHAVYNVSGPMSLIDVIRQFVLSSVQQPTGSSSSEQINSSTVNIFSYSSEQADLIVNPSTIPVPFIQTAVLDACAQGFNSPVVAWELSDLLKHRKVAAELNILDANGGVSVSLNPATEAVLTDHILSTVSLFETAPEMCALQLLKISAIRLLEPLLVTALFSALCCQDATTPLRHAAFALPSSSKQTTYPAFFPLPAPVAAPQSTSAFYSVTPISMASILKNIYTLQSTTKPLIASFLHQVLPQVKYASLKALDSISDLSAIFISTVLQSIYSSYKDPKKGTANASNTTLSNEALWILGGVANVTSPLLSGTESLFGQEIKSRYIRLTPTESIKIFTPTIIETEGSSAAPSSAAQWVLGFPPNHIPTEYSRIRSILGLRPTDAPSSAKVIAELDATAALNTPIIDASQTDLYLSHDVKLDLNNATGAYVWTAVGRSRLLAAAVLDSGAVTMSHLQRALELYYSSLKAVVINGVQTAGAAKVDLEVEIVRALVRATANLPARLEFAIDFLLREDVVSTQAVIKVALLDLSAKAASSNSVSQIVTALSLTNRALKSLVSGLTRVASQRSHELHLVSLYASRISQIQDPKFSRTDAAAQHENLKNERGQIVSNLSVLNTRIASFKSAVHDAAVTAAVDAITALTTTAANAGEVNMSTTNESRTQITQRVASYAAHIVRTLAGFLTTAIPTLNPAEFERHVKSLVPATSQDNETEVAMVFQLLKSAFLGKELVSVAQDLFSVEFEQALSNPEAFIPTVPELPVFVEQAVGDVGYGAAPAAAAESIQE